jgi:hypothetical protein
LEYCEESDVKAVLQLAAEDDSLYDVIEAAIASAEALIDIFLKPYGLAVPAEVPQNIVDAESYFAAWAVRRPADPTGA